MLSQIFMPRIFSPFFFLNFYSCLFNSFIALSMMNNIEGDEYCLTYSITEHRII